ncbi:MAG: tyrosine--tRNA ligase [Candidatus Nomurabacteria bacterium]|nr:tyrosine--tRNA ligase [Candidatus Nomurabacteria bacterium]USN87740.1 MAG: tyrosine--tRNA ligase [Candidatus Nomurabacteria bacterium]
MEVNTDKNKIEELLQRSVKEILPSKEELRGKLLSGQRLKMYIGTDATGTSLHIGHATNYLILEKFRQLGHEIIFLIGDFTSRIGDPTDKSDSARKQLTREEVVENTKSWLNQIRPIIDIDNKENPVTILYNHDWLAALNFEDIIGLASHFTVQQMIERDMFEKRLAENKPLYLHELFYPLMQGYDSVAMEVDMEVCGSDQKFNALAGRTLLKKLKDKDKFVFITTLLENPKTGEKMMSKSQGTGVFLDFDAETMYGAIMAQPDENMHQLFIDCTNVPLSEISGIFAKETNPRDTKMRLAHEITSMYHGANGAKQAENHFVETFQKGQVPEDIPEFSAPYVDNLLSEKIVESKSELRRLLQAGSIRDMETGEKIAELPGQVTKPTVLKIGKRRFVRLLP